MKMDKHFEMQLPHASEAPICTCSACGQDINITIDDPDDHFTWVNELDAKRSLWRCNTTKQLVVVIGGDL
jgi:hypothetical protein